MAARVQQRLREMACVAFLLRNRERMKELLDAGDHAAFEQQAPQLFGAGVHIPQLVTAVQTQTSFYAWLSMRIFNVGGVTGVTIRGVSDARRAKQRRNFLFLAREGADDSFATAHTPSTSPAATSTPDPTASFLTHSQTGRCASTPAGRR